jgi:hypothetical protein
MVPHRPVVKQFSRRAIEECTILCLPVAQDSPWRIDRVVVAYNTGPIHLYRGVQHNIAGNVYDIGDKMTELWPTQPRLWPLNSMENGPQVALLE